MSGQPRHRAAQADGLARQAIVLPHQQVSGARRLVAAPARAVEQTRLVALAHQVVQPDRDTLVGRAEMRIQVAPPHADRPRVAHLPAGDVRLHIRPVVVADRAPAVAVAHVLVAVVVADLQAPLVGVLPSPHLARKTEGAVVAVAARLLHRHRHRGGVGMGFAIRTRAGHGQGKHQVARAGRRGERGHGGVGAGEGYRGAAGLRPGVGDVGAPRAAAGAGVERYRGTRRNRPVVRQRKRYQDRAAGVGRKAQLQSIG